MDRYWLTKKTRPTIASAHAEHDHDIWAVDEYRTRCLREDSRYSHLLADARYRLPRAAQFRLLALHKGVQYTLHNPCKTYARLLWGASRAQQSLESSADQVLRIAKVSRYMLITGHVTRPSIGCGEGVSLGQSERGSILRWSRPDIARYSSSAEDARPPCSWHNDSKALHFATLAVDVEVERLHDLTGPVAAVSPEKVFGRSP